MKVCYVEDDPVARDFVSRGLVQHGIEVDLASDARSALSRIESGHYELLILDVMLPDSNGFELLSELRADGVDVPVLFLSARGAATDRIQGLDLGADDYLVKPFAFAELVARIRAISRRRAGRSSAGAVTIGDLVINEATHSVTRSGRAIHLTPKEFTLLALLVRHRGEVLSRSMIVEKIWGLGFGTYSNLVDVHVNHLRKKLGRDFGSRLIRTVSGVGYTIDPEPGAELP